MVSRQDSAARGCAVVGEVHGTSVARSCRRPASDSRHCLTCQAAWSWESHFSDHRKLSNLLDKRSDQGLPSERTESISPPIYFTRR